MAHDGDAVNVGAQEPATHDPSLLAEHLPDATKSIKTEDAQSSIEQLPESSPAAAAEHDTREHLDGEHNMMRTGLTPPTQPPGSVDALAHEKENGHNIPPIGDAANLDAQQSLVGEPAMEQHEIPYDGLDQENMFLSEVPQEPQPPQDKRAFARLVFSDYSYYMLTLSVVIGRDISIAREARRQKDRMHSLGSADAREVQLGDFITVYEPAPGGYDSDGADGPKEEQDEYDEVHIAIREPEAADGSRSLGKNISRKHARIRYSFEHEGFELVVMGRNGLFVNDIHYEMGDTRILPHGTRIQIGAVRFTFELPNNPGPGSGMSMSAYSMSFEDEAGEEMRDEGFAEADFDEFDIEPPRHHFQGPDDEEDEEEEGDDEDDEDSDERKLERPKKPTKKRGRVIQPPVPNKRKKVMRRGSSPTNGRLAKPKTALVKPTVKKTPKVTLKLKQPKRQEVDIDDSPSDTADDELKEVMKTSRPQAGEKKPATTSAEASKSTKSPAESSKPIVNRDQVLINGEGVNIEGLQPGTVIPPRRKGPGRPPKDGVMSKRERQLLVKREKERERALKMGLDPDSLPPLDLTAPKAPPKPKPDNREFQFNSGRPPDAVSAAAANIDPLLSDKRGPAPSKDVREPSPEMKESDYTPEQLERPPGNYVTIIHEILSEKGRMNLQQIYSAIERKYPYFKFRQQTTGWQSSVRHNLGQHDAFRKAEKDGKGFLWEINPDVPIEPARKPKKQPSPPPSAAYNNQYGHQRYPQQAQYGQPPANGYSPQNRPQNYQSPQAPSQLNGAAQGLAAGQRPGNYSSPYANPASSQPGNHANGGAPSQASTSNRASPAQGQFPGPPGGQASSATPGSQSPGPSSGTNQGQRRPEHNPWSRDTLINTVKKIYASRVPPGFSLDNVAIRAVDAFMNPSMKFNPPLSRLEGDIVLALQQAHHSQVTGIPVQSGAPPQSHGQSPHPPGHPVQVGAQGASPAPQNRPASSTPQPGATASPAAAPGAAAAAARALSQQGQTNPPPRGGTPQAPQPEPFTRPSSVQEQRQTRSHTPDNEPPTSKAEGLNVPATAKTIDGTDKDATKTPSQQLDAGSSAGE